MNTTMIVSLSAVAMALVLIAAVYVGLHFSKKSAQKRRETEAVILSLSLENVTQGDFFGSRGLRSSPRQFLTVVISPRFHPTCWLWLPVPKNESPDVFFSQTWQANSQGLFLLFFFSSPDSINVLCVYGGSWLTSKRTRPVMTISSHVHIVKLPLRNEVTVTLIQELYVLLSTRRPADNAGIFRLGTPCNHYAGVTAIALNHQEVHD